jgi:hypothetical protein
MPENDVDAIMVLVSFDVGFCLVSIVTRMKWEYLGSVYSQLHLLHLFRCLSRTPGQTFSHRPPSHSVLQTSTCFFAVTTYLA